MQNTSRVFKWSVIIGIVIVLNLFFNYALSLVYKEPAFDAFCKPTQVVESIDDKNQCLSGGGQWSENVYPKSIDGRTEVRGYCDQQFTCRNNYEAARKTYDRNVFVTLVVLGALCVAGGNFLKGNIVLGQSLSLAGVLSFVVASMRYWSSANDAIKVVILAIALLILVWVAVKRFRD